jgi:arylsulfate sulfotransferase
MRELGISTMSSRLAVRAAARLWLVPVLFLAGCGGASLKDILPKPAPSEPAPPSTPAPVAGQSGSVTISPQYVALAPGQSFQFTATGGGQLAWFVNGTQGGSSSSGTVSSTGNYTAPASVTQSENVTVTVALAGSTQQNYASAIVAIIQPAQVTCPSGTGNPLVSLYSIYLPAPGKASVEFGTTTNYGLNTWQVPTPSANGGGLQIWVAGIPGNTTFHMRGLVVLDNGATYTGPDITCTTGVPPISSPVQVSSSGTPQPGIEMWNTILPTNYVQAFATDLNGNVIWTYNYQHTSTDYVQGVQILPNGNLLTVISYLSSMTTAQSSSVINEIRQIDLDGNTVSSLTMPELNQKLAAGNFRDAEGNLYQLGSFHHDVLPLPNGHMVLLATYTRNFTNLPGYPGNTTVIGDALVDVDQNQNPDWVWNTFDHLDVNRHPMNFPDWTHSNGLLYSADDGNLLLSMRHQNWIIKINFLGGTGSGAPAGSGDIMWHLGEGGDFTLVGATDPTDWFYAQHGMSYFTPNTTGVFRIGLMDNGNDRLYPTGRVFCAPYGPISAQCYSTMPLLQIDETNMTATMIDHYLPPDTDFSFFGGNAELLANGDIEVDFCATRRGAIVQELSPQGNQVVWQGLTAGADQFHVYRLPSLYPGVQW